jgi:hypothetical protein
VVQHRLHALLQVFLVPARQALLRHHEAGHVPESTAAISAHLGDLDNDPIIKNTME